MPQIFTISLNGVVYTITLFWCDAADGGWVMNIGDAQNNPILNGVPLVTGADLLGQYEYLGIGIAIFVQTDNDPNAVPTFTNLGINSHIYYAVIPA